MTERATPDRVAVLTATVDQLQAEVDRHHTTLALLFGCIVGLGILVMLSEVEIRRLKP